MKFKCLMKKVIVTGLIILFPGIAFATNGYFQPGIGIKAKGMGGAAIALPQDALAGAINPAGMAFIGNRIDFGVDFFSPIRQATYSGTTGPWASDGTYKSGANLFTIPSFGFNMPWSDDITVGLTFYGNGGMNTSYKEPIPLLGGVAGNQTNPGVDFMQAFMAPTVTYKVTETGAVGLAVNLALQRFKAYGLQNFDNAGFSTSVGNVTNNGYDYSLGIGARIGWKGDLTENLSLGVTYQTVTKMQKFEKYAGLFAEQGGFDVPQNFGVGIAIKEVVPKTTFAFDAMWINYSGVNSVGNALWPSVGAMMTPGQMLGDDNGTGFGWKDIWSFRFGVQHEYSNDVTLRAGYNYGDNPIPTSETFFNTIAPGVVKHHLSIGTTIKVLDGKELTLSYVHAFKNTVKGSGSIAPGFGGGEVDLQMYQNAVGVSLGW